MLQLEICLKKTTGKISARGALNTVLGLLIKLRNGSEYYVVNGSGKEKESGSGKDKESGSESTKEIVGSPPCQKIT